MTVLNYMFMAHIFLKFMQVFHFPKYNLWILASDKIKMRADKQLGHMSRFLSSTSLIDITNPSQCYNPGSHYNRL